MQISVISTNPTGASDNGQWNETVVNPPAASVTLDGAVVRLPPATVSFYDFTVTNTGSVNTTYTLVAVCSGTGVTNCTPSPTSLPVNAGASGTGRVNFTTGAGTTTGLVDLQAKVGSTVLDDGTLNVTVAPAPPAPPPPGIDITQNAGAILAREQCLTIALASASASECGDLRVVHSLPSVRTMNRWRTPTLVYNSAQAIGWVSVAADLTLAPGDAPTTVTARLNIGGVTRVNGTWAGNQWMSGSTRRIALGFTGPAQGLSTGVYDYVFSVTKNNAGGPITDSVSGKLAIVDRSTSYFGAGWWLAGLEKWDQATGLWVGGDGSVRLYTQRAGSVAPNRVWGAPSITYPDTIREISGGAEFIRQLPDSVWVYFNQQGYHTKTRNSKGHITSFGYDGNWNLAGITLPPGPSPLSYSFNSSNGRLTSVVAPGVPSVRTTNITIDPVTRRLTDVVEPDNRTVHFGYGTDSTDNKIMSRTDRRATVTNFEYDVGNRVSQATINLVPGTITRSLRQTASRGFAGTAALPTDLFTRLDGPRSVNTMSFYVNRFGAPDTIVDGLNQRTWLVRAAPGFLGLVTQASTVTGHTVNATYDARGRIFTSSEPSTSGQIATTTFMWDTKWDQITRITNPEGDFTDFGVDPTTGNRSWQQDGRGIATRTTFQYWPDNQISNVIPPNSGAHSYDYDNRGNLHTYFSAIDLGFTWTNNDIGLTTEILTPTGPCCQPGGAPYQTETVSYSVLNEDTVHVTSLSGESVTLRRVYDAEGNLDTLSRSFSPNSAGIALPLVTSWQYDRANRQTRQTEPDGTAERRVFDAAGNLESDTSRRNLVISMTYNALNRMSTRSLPAVSVSLPNYQIYPATPVNTLPYSYSWTTDNQTFQYTPDGQVSVATSKDATVARVFHASGRIVAETLGIKSTDRATTHLYATAYTYDRDGRRKSLTAPGQFTGGAVSYGYDALWGALTSVKDIAGTTFSFGYNERSELTGITYGGGVSETLGYDGDGRLSSDIVTNSGAQTFPRFPGAQLRNFSVANRNARDQIRSSSEAVMSDKVDANFSGLGHVEASHMRQDLFSVRTGGPVVYATVDTTIYDGLGNIMATAFWDSVYIDQWDRTRRIIWNSYTPLGRLSGRSLEYTAPGTVYCCDSTSYSYDSAGNAYFEATRDYASIVKSERAAYYGPDEKLLATDTRTSGRRTFEEYRYDAFGRRIFIRSVKTCEGGVHTVDCHAPFVRRTIWDGGQELAEIQVPVDLGDPPAVPGNPEIEEMDTGYPLRMYYPNLDPDAYYGRVVYGPGLAVDQPLSVTRYEYRDAPDGGASLTWPRFSWQILWNYQGLPAFGTLTTGAWAYPYQLGQNQTSCPVPTDVTLQRCVKVQWPLAHSAYDQNRGNITYPSWHGSLLEGKRDRSGLEYKRNRQYDPATGRFTQEDPIGLAGGLNAYGFAAGDPVGNGDPFGVYCQRHGSDRMTCTGAPGDWWTISEFLGGATGRATFQAAQQAGLTRWSSSTCRGGFSDDACSQIAAGLAKLIVREIEQCSALGTRAAKRFEAGRFRLHQGMIGRHRDKTGLATPRILFWGGTTTLSSELFGTGRYAYGLQWVIAHEEMHHYLFGEGILNNVVLGEGPANDAGNRCGN
ncbi:MAG TPA: RHS repeat-associated core domain-containing protein [Gemmatimonadales bacterium]|nr:RHS repeat-associated core domain-containing protein [Gemmatimonadales bacterium]